MPHNLVSPARLAGSPRVALVHDWLNGYRGGEKVLRVLVEMFPQAEVFTLFYQRGASHPTIEARPVHASWMNGLPRVHDYYRWLLPLYPGWADRLDLSRFDLVISTSHCVAKSARPAPDAVHVCYCFTPMRYVWDQYDVYFGDARGLKRAVVSRVASRLRAWDRASATRVHRFVAISRFVRERIVQSYGLEREQVDVLFAPADLTGLSPPQVGATREDRYLVVSALVPYKRVEVAVEACARSGRRLTVAGSGPELGRLRQLAQQLGAGDRVEFAGHVDDARIARLMQTHRAFLFPGVEDFGLTPLEAAACGLPVIGLACGGILDTMIDGVTAHFYDDPSAAGLADAIAQFEREDHAYDPLPMRAHAERFSPAAFAARIAEICERTLRAQRAQARAVEV